MSGTLTIPVVPASEPSGFSAFARFIIARFAGLPLSEAEAILDMTRRLLWTQIFTGAGYMAVFKMLCSGDEALFLAGEVSELSGGKLMLCEQILLELRACLYATCYAEASGTAFGENWASELEEQGRYEAPPSSVGKSMDNTPKGEMSDASGALHIKMDPFGGKPPVRH